MRYEQSEHSTFLCQKCFAVVPIKISIIFTIITPQHEGVSRAKALICLLIVS